MTESVLFISFIFVHQVNGGIKNWKWCHRIWLLLKYIALLYLLDTPSRENNTFAGGDS